MATTSRSKSVPVLSLSTVMLNSYSSGECRQLCFGGHVPSGGKLLKLRERHAGERRDVRIEEVPCAITNGFDVAHSSSERARRIPLVVGCRYVPARSAPAGVRVSARAMATERSVGAIQAYAG